jgi:Zn-finger nucleic acid-binding protein
VLCPNDGTELHQVETVAHYGQPITVDQCGRCGGIWFDESELFRTKLGEADRIELLDAELLRAACPSEAPELVCPRDRTSMVRFSDPCFPEDITLVRCLLCHGIWLNRGIFARYQQFRSELRRPGEKPPRDEELQERINQLIEAYHSGGSSETLRSLGEFLSAPVEARAPISSAHPQMLASANGAAVALSTLMAIFRAIVLRF